MTLLRFFKLLIPNPEEAVISSKETEAANKEVEKLQIVARKKKRHSTYSDAGRAKIGKYAAENEQLRIKCFRTEYEKLAESTLGSLKKKNISKLLMKRTEMAFICCWSHYFRKERKEIDLEWLIRCAAVRCTKD